MVIVYYSIVRSRNRMHPSRMKSMHHVGFEPTISIFKKAKNFHVLNRAATVIGKAIIKE
jgi:hypothetical protein